MRRYELEGGVYDSRSEEGVAALLTHYIPSFTPIENITVHVKCANTTLDFVLENAVVEWHPLTHNETIEEYKTRKERMLRDSPFSDKKLIIVGTLSEIHTKVLEHFGKNVPTYEEVTKEYYT